MQIAVHHWNTFRYGSFSEIHTMASNSDPVQKAKKRTVLANAAPLWTTRMTYQGVESFVKWAMKQLWTSLDRGFPGTTTMKTFHCIVLPCWCCWSRGVLLVRFTVTARVWRTNFTTLCKKLHWIS